MACPNDETLLALIDGRLGGEALASADEHLDSCETCREVIATLASGSRARGTRTGGPETLGRFVVLERIGEGAMGAVFSAYDPELDRKVALKRLHPAASSATRRARLTREAQAMARLTHPNVVTVFDVGVQGDDVYVAMELVRGESLRGWLARAHTTHERLDVLLQAGRGLAAAHHAGLVHRDFKPENVLVGSDGRVLVGDFGLAGERDDGHPPAETDTLLAASLTETGAILGTPAYMAPEQLGGQRASELSDQFAFAVTAWETLEGARPFGEARSIAALREAITRGPGAASSMSRGPERALRRALSVDPRARWPSMDALLVALREDGSRAPWMVLGVVGALLAAILAVPLLSRDPCAASRAAIGPSWSDAVRRQVLPAALPGLDAWAARWTSTRVDACEATHERHEQSEALLDARMACLDRLRRRFDAIAGSLRDEASLSSMPELLAALPEPAACDAPGPSLASDPATREVIARIQERLDEGAVLVATARHADALALADELAGDADVLDHASLVAETQLLRSDALRAAARYDDSLEAARHSLFRAEDAGDGRGMVQAWLAIVRALGAAGRYAEAEDFLPHLETALTRAGSPADLREPMLRARASVRMETGRLAEARSDLDEALTSMRARLGEGSLELAPVHTSLGNLARLEARLEDALREHETALALDRAALGEAHPRLARDLHNVAGILRRLERREEARARYEQALSISTRALGDDHPEAALTRNSLGLLAFEAGETVVARTHWERALADLSAHGHGDAALASYNLALLELAEDHPDVAVARARQAIAIDARNVGVDAKRVAGEHLVLGRALARLSRPAEAREALTRARELARDLEERELEVDVVAELDALDALSAPLEPGPDASGSRPAERSTTTRAGPAPITRIAPAPAPVAGSAHAPTPVPVPVPATPPAPVPVPQPVPVPVPVPPPPVTHHHPAGSGAYGAGVPWE